MSNETKSRALGINFGTASNQLRKLILFNLLRRLHLDRCFRCSKIITDSGDLSIEHKESWQSADDPKVAFFDLHNIAFSHLRCNSGAAESAKESCPDGHPYDEMNTRRRQNGDRTCRTCERFSDQRRRPQRREQQRRYNREYAQRKRQSRRR